VVITSTQVHGTIAVDPVGKRRIAWGKKVSSPRPIAVVSVQPAWASDDECLPWIVKNNNGAVVASGKYVLHHVTPEEADHLNTC
jgi:hypothetical protein